MAQAAWDARDDARLRALLSPDLLVEWRRRLADFAARGWHNRVEVLEVSSVEYLGLVNREGIDDDRVTCRISARLRDWVETEWGERHPSHRREQRADRRSPSTGRSPAATTAGSSPRSSPTPRART